MKRLLINITFIIAIFTITPSWGGGVVNWHGDIIISGGGFVSVLTIGNDHEAEDGYDNRFDIPALSPSDNTLGVGAVQYIFPYFLQGDKRLSKDIRSPHYGGIPKEWDFEVFSNLPDSTPVTIDLKGIVNSIPDGSDIRFVYNGSETGINTPFIYNSIFGKTERFTVNIYNIPYNGPIVPEPVSIANYINNKKPSFIWNTVSEAGSYHIKISFKRSFVSPVVDTVISENNYTPQNDLKEGDIYWKISAIDKDGNEGAYSEAEHFVIDTTPPDITDLAIPQSVWEPEGKFYFNTDKDAKVTVSTTAKVTSLSYSDKMQGWYSYISGLRKGRNDITITAVDQAGNISRDVKTFIELLDMPVEIDNTDTDSDGMPDAWEVLYGLNPNDPSDSNIDSDHDSLTNFEEYFYLINPNNPDSDGDGMPDGWEVDNRLIPDFNDAGEDSDGNGIINIDEYLNYKYKLDNQPVARIKINGQNISELTITPFVINLEGIDSSDPNGDTLIYNWSQDIDNPESFTFAVDNNGFQTAINSFIFEKKGRYIFTLIVSDGMINSDPVSATVIIENVFPSADAGAGRVIATGTAITLDGKGSSDANGDSITYLWSLETGQLENAYDFRGENTAEPVFTPKTSGTFRFKLVVSDGESDSEPSHVDIVVNNPNIVPSADAGEDQVVEAGSIVKLDGTRSIDPDNMPNPLAYAWKIETAPEAVILSDESAVTPTYKSILSGVYQFSLTVYDGKDVSVPDYINVTVNNPNKVPIANAGGDKSVKVGDIVELGGGRSFDEDNGPLPLTYQWEQTEGGLVTLNNADNMIADFIPLNPGVLKFDLRVYDGKDVSLPDSVNVTVEDDNSAPTANAGEDQKGGIGEAIYLRGNLSSDPDGDKLNYIWTQVSGGTAVLNGYDTVSPYFSAISAGIYRFSLVVSDGELRSLPDEVVVEIEKKGNHRPIAKIKGEKIVKTGESVILSGRKSHDPDKDPLTYRWRQVYGVITEIKGKESETATVLISREGRYEYELIVSDGNLESRPDNIEIYAISKKGLIRDIIRDRDNEVEEERGGVRTKINIPSRTTDNDIKIGVTHDYDDRHDDYPFGLKAYGGETIKIVPEELKLKNEIKITIISSQRSAISSQRSAISSQQSASKGIVKQLSSLSKSNTVMAASNEGGFKVYKYNEETKEWNYYSDASVGNEGSVSFRAAEFGEFVVAGDVSKDAIEIPVGDAPVSTPLKNESILVNPDSESGKGCFIGLIAGADNSEPEKAQSKEHDMVLIPEGEFIMGNGAQDGKLGMDVSIDELFRHKVYLKSYYIDRFETTNIEYKKFIDETKRETPKNLTHPYDSYNWKDGTYPYRTDNFPVSLVGWDDADTYCKWKGKRLLKETEWEKGARGTDDRRFPWGNTFDILKANVRELGLSTLVPVGTFPSGVSPYGVHDMIGNVAEWVSDICPLYEKRADSNKDIDHSDHSHQIERMYRGGGFTHFSRPYVRITYRGTARSDYRHRSIGFRCAKDFKISDKHDL